VLWFHYFIPELMEVAVGNVIMNFELIHRRGPVYFMT
jgi:hypothetical protein